MEELLKEWGRRAKKYRELVRKTESDRKAEGLLCAAETYELCIDEIKRKLKE